jgi:CO/xanthine dehydrogenase FAD-binding subunit
MALELQTFSSSADASAALRAGGRTYLGGGTLVVRSANEGDIDITGYVRSTDPALTAIDTKGGRARLGASVTMADIVGHSDLAVLAPAAKMIGGPAVRNVATVGGNLFAVSPYGDFTVALLALGATIHFADGEMGIDAFIAGRDGVTAARGIVVAISFDIPASERFRFLKISRVKPKGVSVLTIAAAIGTDPGGKIKDARIALGCMADRPVRAKAAEQALVGSDLTESGVAKAVSVIGEGTTPITDPIASAWYRAEVLPVHFRRLMLD